MGGLAKPGRLPEQQRRLPGGWGGEEREIVAPPGTLDPAAYTSPSIRRKEVEERLLQAEKLRSLGQLASGIAHDLNNMLTVIRGHAELGLRSPCLDPAVREHLQAVLEGAANATEVVRRIQGFYRPADPADIHPLDLNHVIATTAAQIQSSLFTLRPALGQGSQVKLELGLLPPLTGNERELGQLFTNLMLNALDAMPQGGALSIATFHQGEKITVVVKDTGIGMTEEVRRRIFEPFFTTKGEAGTGLGLSISQGIVQRHGGEILVQSQPGEGTSFTLHFPLLSSQAAPSLQMEMDSPGQGAPCPPFTPMTSSSTLGR